MEQGNRVRVSINNLSKTFYSNAGEAINVVNGISFDVYNNEFLVILGPGRCGKTILLNMITGLQKPDSGEVSIDGRVVTGVAPEMGMVFQKLGLMPWLTIMENVEFGPKMRGVSKKERREKAAHFLDLVGLTGFENHYPYQLSGE